MLEEYLPEPGQKPGDLVGMGGVYNYANLAVYHYGGNNPLKYVDPDGRTIRDWYARNRKGLMLVVGGGATIALGYLIAGGSPAGGAAIAAGTGGAGAPAGAAVASAGVAAGKAIAATGGLTLTAGLAMLASDSSGGSGGDGNNDDNETSDSGNRPSNRSLFR